MFPNQGTIRFWRFCYTALTKKFRKAPDQAAAVGASLPEITLSIEEVKRIPTALGNGSAEGA